MEFQRDNKCVDILCSTLKFRLQHSRLSLTGFHSQLNEHSLCFPLYYRICLVWQRAFLLLFFSSNNTPHPSTTATKGQQVESLHCMGDFTPLVAAAKVILWSLCHHHHPHKSFTLRKCSTVTHLQNKPALQLWLWEEEEQGQEQNLPFSTFNYWCFCYEYDTNVRLWHFAEICPWFCCWLRHDI